jgi:hypothetical protein
MHLIPKNKQLAYSNPLMEENIEALAEGCFRCPKKDPDPQFCTLHCYINAKTGGSWKGEQENKSLTVEAGWSYEKKGGLKDRCPKRGEGCNPFSCQEVAYNAGSGL